MESEITEKQTKLVYINTTKYTRTQNYQIHEVKNPFQQYSPTLKIFQNSAKLKLTDKYILNMFIRKRKIKGKH